MSPRRHGRFIFGRFRLQAAASGPVLALSSSFLRRSWQGDEGGKPPLPSATARPAKQSSSPVRPALPRAGGALPAPSYKKHPVSLCRQHLLPAHPLPERRSRGFPPPPAPPPPPPPPYLLSRPRLHFSLIVLPCAAGRRRAGRRRRRRGAGGGRPRRPPGGDITHASARSLALEEPAEGGGRLLPQPGLPRRRRQGQGAVR